MSSEQIEIGLRLNETVALQAAADAAQVVPALGDSINIDFGGTKHFEPFGMLLLGSAIRRLQQRSTSVGATVHIRLPLDAEEGIAGYLGFWQSIGLNIGRKVNAPAGKDSYLPITRLDIAELFQRGGGDPRGTGLLESEAARLAKVLAGSGHNALEEALTYSFRELMRNVIEHAMSPYLWVAGMSWPRRDYIQVAILDEGRGIRHSLADNPSFRFETDEKAIRESLKAGVTRNKGRERSTAEIERWEDARHILPLSVFDNLGYGLYMISTFCRDAGQFLVASGSSYLGFIASAEVIGSTLHKGTALRLVLEPTKVEDAFERLFESINQDTQGTKRKLLSASTLKKLGLDSLRENGK